MLFGDCARHFALNYQALLTDGLTEGLPLHGGLLGDGWLGERHDRVVLPIEHFVLFGHTGSILVRTGDA